MVSSIKYIDEVRTYSTEKDLIKLINDINPDIRIIGSDWKDKKITGFDLSPIYFPYRNHNYSTTNLREKIKNAS